MKPAQVDVAVLILFFNRPEPLSCLWEEIKKARPSKLLLYQDGPRNEKDMPGIMACREVVKDIDWDCEVHTNFQEKNLGCDPAEFLSEKWAFSIVEKCIIFDDDDVPSQSFFPFCKELLDRYEHDQRISMIAGSNYDEESKDVPYDYFFTSYSCINGWASWRRVIEQWDDENYSFLDNKYYMSQLKALSRQRLVNKNFLFACHSHRGQRKAFYETLLQAHMLLSSSLSIVPTRNLITNQGALPGSTHVVGTNQNLPKGYRKIFSMKKYDFEFPLKHPLYVIEDVKYKERINKLLLINHPFLKVLSSFEELFFSLRHGNFKYIGKSIKNRVNKIFGRYNSHY